MSPDPVDATVEPEEQVEPVGHVRVVYLGPVAPHWDVQSDFGRPSWSTPSGTAPSPAWSCCRPTTRSSAATANGSCATPSGRT